MSLRHEAVKTFHIGRSQGLARPAGEKGSRADAAVCRRRGRRRGPHTASGTAAQEAQEAPSRVSHVCVVEPMFIVYIKLQTSYTLRLYK